MKDTLFYAAPWLITAILVLLKANQKDAGRHRGFKFIHALFVLFLVCMCGPSCATLVWGASHPLETMEQYFVTNDLFAPWANFTIWALDTILTVLKGFLGLVLACRNKAASQTTVRMIPFLCIADWMEAIRTSLSHPIPRVPYPVIWAILFLMAFIPYLLMYVFYTRRTVIDALFSTKGKSPQNEQVQLTANEKSEVHASAEVEQRLVSPTTDKKMSISKWLGAALLAGSVLGGDVFHRCGIALVSLKDFYTYSQQPNGPVVFGYYLHSPLIFLLIIGAIGVLLMLRSVYQKPNA